MAPPSLGHDIAGHGCAGRRRGSAEHYPFNRRARLVRRGYRCNRLNLDSVYLAQAFAVLSVARLEFEHPALPFGHGAFVQGRLCQSDLSDGISRDDGSFAGAEASPIRARRERNHVIGRRLPDRCRHTSRRAGIEPDGEMDRNRDQFLDCQLPDDVIHLDVAEWPGKVAQSQP